MKGGRRGKECSVCLSRSALLDDVRMAGVRGAVGAGPPLIGSRFGKPASLFMPVNKARTILPLTVDNTN